MGVSCSSSSGYVYETIRTSLGRLSRVTGQTDDESIADFADAVLDIARKLALRAPDRREIVPLTGTEVDVIREIIRNPGTNATQIAAATRLRRSNVSAAMRVLESRELIIKEQVAEDARFVRLTATPYAIENVEKIRALWVRRLRALPPALLAEAAAAHELLERVNSHMEA
nr:helix-turn-helix domain-containing protein [Curtobacterium pusillum]